MNTKQRKEAIEQFFEAAFVAESATVLIPAPNVNVMAVVEIDTGDERGVIHIAQVELKDE